jgi:hypothetical protein
VQQADVLDPLPRAPVRLGQVPQVRRQVRQAFLHGFLPEGGHAAVPLRLRKAQLRLALP